MNLLKAVLHLPRRLAQALIRVYQFTLSPDHSWLRHYFPGGYCPYRPSCSSYALLAIAKYGLIRGGLKSLWRILRCHPWTKGGLDLP